jgi:hypothetical protein
MTQNLTIFMEDFKITVLGMGPPHRAEELMQVIGNQLEMVMVLEY